MSRHRQRIDEVPGNTYLGSDYYRDVWTGNYIWMRDTYYPTINTGRTVRRAEHCYDELHSGPPYRTGGPFDKTVYTDGGMDVQNVGTYYNSTSYFMYSGGFVSRYKPQDAWGVPMSDYGSPGTSNAFGDLTAYESTAWNKFKPGKPTADVGVFLGELRDLPRMLQGTAKFFHNAWKAMGGAPDFFGPKRVADAWLNTQFGWLPFLSDMRKFAKTYADADRQIAHLRRNNGKWVRRGGSVRQVTDSEVVSESATNHLHSPILNTYFYPGASSGYYGNHTVTRETSQRVWFKAAFRYYIPNIRSVKWERKALRLLYGGGISPSLLWNLTPWTWLVDWASSVGDAVANLDNNLAENLAAKYAYIMGTTEESYRIRSHCALSSPIDAEWEFLISRKTRSTASPFGFGLTSDDFSGRQWSILSALGLTRLR